MCSGKSRGSRNEINRTRDETGETWRGRERAKPKAEAIRRSFRFFSPPPPLRLFFFFLFSLLSPPAFHRVLALVFRAPASRGSGGESSLWNS